MKESFREKKPEYFGEREIDTTGFTETIEAVVIDI